MKINNKKLELAAAVEAAVVEAAAVEASAVTPTTSEKRK